MRAGEKDAQTGGESGGVGTLHQQEPRWSQLEPTPTERRFLKALHWMRCPKCGLELKTERRGTLDLDVCSACGGAWIDRPQLKAAADHGRRIVSLGALGLLRRGVGRPVRPCWRAGLHFPDLRTFTMRGTSQAGLLKA